MRSQLRDYQGNIDQPFAHERYRAEPTDLSDQLKAGLSATDKEEPGKTGPNVGDLPNRIKGLLASNVVEAAADRVSPRTSTAEGPVTARIRRRTESHDDSGTSGNPGEPAVTDPRCSDHPATAFDPLADHQRPFQERPAADRRRKDQEPSLS